VVVLAAIVATASWWLRRPAPPTEPEMTEAEQTQLLKEIGYLK
jgi:hypothetical protein